MPLEIPSVILRELSPIILSEVPSQSFPEDLLEMPPGVLPAVSPETLPGVTPGITSKVTPETNSAIPSRFVPGVSLGEVFQQSHGNAFRSSPRNCCKSFCNPLKILLQEFRISSGNFSRSSSINRKCYSNVLPKNLLKISLEVP